MVGDSCEEFAMQNRDQASSDYSVFDIRIFKLDGRLRYYVGGQQLYIYPDIYTRWNEMYMQRYTVGPVVLMHMLMSQHGTTCIFYLFVYYCFSFLLLFQTQTEHSYALIVSYFELQYYC